MGNHSKKYPVDNNLRNVVHTPTSTTSNNVYDAAKHFFFQLFMLIDWQGHSCFRVREHYRIPESSYGIHLFGDIVLGPRPPDNNDRTVLSLHKYAHLIVDNELRPLFKTAEEIQALKPLCGPSCIELILRNKDRKASTRATPVIAFKLGKGESSGIITGGTSAYIQYVSYAETAFEPDRYISLLTPIDGNRSNNDDEQESLLVVEAVDIVMEQEQQLAAAIASEEKKRKNEFQDKENKRFSLLNRFASTHKTLESFATKLKDDLLGETKRVYPDLDQSIETNVTQALKFIESATKKLKAVKKTAAYLAGRNDHVVTESRNVAVKEVIELRVRSNFKHVTFPMLNQKNVWGPADSDFRKTKEIAKQFTVIFNNVAHILSQLLPMPSEKVPNVYMVAWKYNCETYWKNFLLHPNCRFGSLKYFLRFMHCCVVPVTKNTEDYNLFLDMEPKQRAVKRRQEFHLHFWEAICKVANSYASVDNARLFIAPSYADFEYAILTNKLESILVRKNDVASDDGKQEGDDGDNDVDIDDEENNVNNDGGTDTSNNDEAAKRKEDEHEDKQGSSPGRNNGEQEVDDGDNDGASDDDDEARVENGGVAHVNLTDSNNDEADNEGISHDKDDEVVLDGVAAFVDRSTDGNDEEELRYLTGCSPSDLLPKQICTSLKSTFLNIFKKRNNVSCYTQCAAIDCINVIDESKGVCLKCNVSKFCTKCTTQDGVCQTCNYLVDESAWMKAFPSLSIIDESCWQMSMEMINNDPKFPKTNGTSKAWSELTKDEIDNYTEVSYADASKTPAAILKIFGDDVHTLYGSTMFRIMHEGCWISQDTHDAIVAIMNDSYSQYYVDQLLRADASSSNPPVKVHKYLNVCVRFR